MEELTMIMQTITYTDYNGNERKENFFFNLSKAELMEMEASKKGGLSNYIQSIIEAQDVTQLMGLFKELIIKSYGVKSPDGKRFIKNQEVVDEFIQSEAYSELYVMLATDEQKATAFVNGIIPQSIVAK